MTDSFKMLYDIILNGKESANRILKELRGQAIIAESMVLPSKEYVSENRENTNQIICGDNLKVISTLSNELLESNVDENKLIDLIYVDPPFFSESDYSNIISIQGPNKNEKIRQTTYSDKWNKGIKEYLEMLYVRLYLMKRMLKGTGNIFIHLDWHVVHYVKVLMDEIFGYNNFQNEIIWRYNSGGISKRRYSRKHDTILWYSKTNQYYFKPDKAMVPRNACQLCGKTQNKWNNMKKNIDENGRVYRTIKSAGKIYRYYDDAPVMLSDVWLDVSHIQQKDPQRTGFTTQKPQKLLQRIIESASPPGGLVGDFFGGSGTTAAVAELTNRRWIVADESSLACSIMYRRLAHINTRPFCLCKLGQSNRKLHIEESTITNTKERGLPKEHTTLHKMHYRISDVEKTIGTNNRNIIKNVNKVGVESSCIEDGSGKLIVDIRINDYKVQNKDILSLNKNSQKSIKRIYESDPLSLIMYWSIDTCYNERVFVDRYRFSRICSDSKMQHMDMNTCIELDSKELMGTIDNRVICIKIIDLFGNTYYKTIKV